MVVGVADREGERDVWLLVFLEREDGRLTEEKKKKKKKKKKKERRERAGDVGLVEEKIN